jgi:hypothetical protein
VSVWTDLRDGIRQAILLEARVERLIVDVEKAEERLIDHDRRLTRVETLIALAASRQLTPPG